MQSRYDPEDARHFVEEQGEQDEALALRAYTAQLIAQAPQVVPFDGACSVYKGPATDLIGEICDVIYVPAAGVDLETIGPADFVPCHLDGLKRLSGLTQLDNARVEQLVRRERLNPDHAAPAVDGLLLAHIPGRYAELEAANALLQLMTEVETTATRELCGGNTLSIADHRGVAALTEAIATGLANYVEQHGEAPEAILLERRGAIVWADSAEESYRKVTALVSQAQEVVASKLEPVSTTELMGTEQDDARRTVALAVRGAMKRASAEGWIAKWHSSPEALRFTRRPDLVTLASLGSSAPAHARATKPYPLVLDELGGANPDALATLLDGAIADYAGRYEAYIERHAKHSQCTVGPIDPWPRVVLVAGLGLLSLGRNGHEAKHVGNLYAHTIDIISAADALGGYQALPEQTLFEAEMSRAHSLHGNDGPLSSLVALVTGAASGIGLATSRAMLAAGAHVAITDRDARVVEAVSEWPNEHYPDRCVSLVCNVAHEPQCQDAVAATCDAFGGIDILVSNAGVAPSGALHTESGDTALRRSLDINLLGHQRIAREVAQAMLNQGTGGALLFNASKSAFSQGPDFGPYAVPKAALLSLMRQYAVDLGRYGIRANAVNADRIRTRQFASHRQSDLSELGVSPSAYFRANLLRRETTAEAVADAFVYLACAEATTGCVITVDGGNPAAFPR